MLLPSEDAAQHDAKCGTECRSHSNMAEQQADGYSYPTPERESQTRGLCLIHAESSYVPLRCDRLRLSLTAYP